MFDSRHLKLKSMDNLVIKTLSAKAENFKTLQASCLHMAQWAPQSCVNKNIGGMEQWAKDFEIVDDTTLSCDWYHSTWQFLRLVDMVAVPDWYPFYVESITEVLLEKPTAKIFISACADYGMLAKLHEAMEEYQFKTGEKCNPQITIADICLTPLQNAKWYADNASIKLETLICDNIILGNFPESEFDLIITDEFLSVIKDDLKQAVVDKWKYLLRPGGCIVTTAMEGEPTTPERREFYAQKARKLIGQNPHLFPVTFKQEDFEKVMQQTDKFASLHTRHMIRNREQLTHLFRNFDYLQLDPVETPGECVNPTYSYQIVAKLGM
jgi:hypothetical protein